jgi:hypothetical protein
LEGSVTKKKYVPRLDSSGLALKVNAACFELHTIRSPIVGRPTLDDVGDID